MTTIDNSVAVPNALEILFSEHYDKFLRYAKRIAREDDLAEDVVHSSFLKLSEKGAISGLDNKNLKAIFTTIKNNLIDEFRKRRKINQMSIDDDSIKVENEFAEKMSVSPVFSDDPKKIFDAFPEEEFYLKRAKNFEKQRQILNGCLSKFGRHEQEIIKLMIEGYGNEQIANLKDLDFKKVGKRVNILRGKLKYHIEAALKAELKKERETESNPKNLINRK